MKTLVIIQARSGSKRLPNKINLPLGNKTLLQWAVEGAVKSEFPVVVATSNKFADDSVEKLCKKLGVGCFRGSEENVLLRIVECAKVNNAEIIVRVCGDQPFLDFEVLKRAVKEYNEFKPDLLNTRTIPVLPQGIDVEVVSRQLLEEVLSKTTKEYHLEHVTSYLYENNYTIKNISLLPELFRPELKLTIDTKEDLDFARRIVQKLGEKITTREIISLLENNPEIYKLTNKKGIMLVSAGKEYGVGHISTALELVKELPLELELVIVTDEPNHEFVTKAKTIVKTHVIGFGGILEKLKKFNPEFVLVDMDSRTYDKELIKKLPGEVILFDVLGDVDYNVQMIFNRNPDESKHNYLGSKAIIYTGLKYVSLGIIKKRIIPIEKVDKIFASFGGSDPCGFSEKIHQENITLAVFDESRRAALAGAVAPIDLNNELAEFDLIICSGGTTLLKAMATGVPRIAIPQNEYEAKQIEFLENNGVVVYLRDLGNLNQKIAGLTPKKLNAQVENGLKMIDGEGTKRIAQRILFFLAR